MLRFRFFEQTLPPTSVRQGLRGAARRPRRAASPTTPASTGGGSGRVTVGDRLTSDCTTVAINARCRRCRMRYYYYAMSIWVRRMFWEYAADPARGKGRRPIKRSQPFPPSRRRRPVLSELFPRRATRTSFEISLISTAGTPPILVSLALVLDALRWEPAGPISSCFEPK